MRSKDKIFFISDLNSDLSKEMAAMIGVEESDLPIVQFVEISDDTFIYRYQSEFTEEKMKDFIEKSIKKVLPRFYPSEPIPTENPGPVFKIVGKTFKSEVIDNDQNVMVKFYAPWCQYCVMLKPIYEKVAKSLEGKIKMCEIDGTKNDVEGHPLDRFPIIKLFLATDKNTPILYDGDLTDEALYEFIEDNTGIQPDIPKQRREEL